MYGTTLCSKMKNPLTTKVGIVSSLLYMGLALLLLYFISDGPIQELLAGETEHKEVWRKNTGLHFPMLALCPIPGFRSSVGANASWPGVTGDAFRFRELGILVQVFNTSFMVDTLNEEIWKEIPSGTVSLLCGIVSSLIFVGVELFLVLFRQLLCS